jgi:peptidoglycan/xylan/chitin deacetylase (PgdA/CDA1 family)
MRPIRAAGRWIINRTGALNVLRSINRGALRILMYHRFRNSGSLELHCRQIRRGYSPVSLQAVALWLDGQGPLPPNPVVVTVDDGYRCFQDTGWPIFSRYQIPVIVYLATDFLDGVSWFWDDQVRYAFLRTARPCFALHIPGRKRELFALHSRDSRLHAALQVNEAAKMLTEEERKIAIQSALESLEVVVPPGPPPGYEPLTWNSVRQLAKAGVQFGAHTKSHAILSRLKNEEAVVLEVEGSRGRIEQELQEPVTHFCYPNGRPCDINPVAVQVVRSAGFRTAVTTYGGLNRTGTDRFLLRRIGVAAETPDYYLAECLAGLHV